MAGFAFLPITDHAIDALKLVQMLTTPQAGGARVKQTYVQVTAT